MMFTFLSSKNIDPIIQSFWQNSTTMWLCQNQKA